MAESDWKNVQRNKNTGQYRTTDGGGGGASNFADLEDVDFDDLQDGQVPKYNSTTQKWENANESGGGGTVTDVEVDGVSVVNQQGVAEITMPTPPSVPDELSDLSDVQFSNLTDHQPLRYNATSQKWVNGADNYPPLIYSDEEREIGVWRDGKPLYQKTFWLSARTSINNSYTTVIISDTSVYSIENIIDFVGYDNNGGADLKRVRLLAGNIDFILSNNNQLIVYAVSNNTYSITGFTIKYTKSTDTAGSGTWTTQGALAHHYSTDEHIIGTWTDGKPIYEKTWEFDSYIIISTNAITSLASKGVVLSDVNFFVNAKLESKVDKRVYNAYSVGYFSGNIGVYNPLNVDAAIDKVVLQYTKTTD